MSAIDVIIPTYNNPEELERCLRGFCYQTFEDFRLLICIDGSFEKTDPVLHSSEFPFPLEILKHPEGERRGRNATRNLAIPHLKASILVTLDSDMVPDVTLLEHHFQLISEKDCVSLGQVVYANRDTNSWADYIQTRGMNKYRNREVLPPYYLTTGNAAMPARYFIELGGQDASMIHYGGGDTEFAYRLNRAFNPPVIFNAKAVAFSVIAAVGGEHQPAVTDRDQLDLLLVATTAQVRRPALAHVEGVVELFQLRRRGQIVLAPEDVADAAACAQGQSGQDDGQQARAERLLANHHVSLLAPAGRTQLVQLHAHQTIEIPPLGEGLGIGRPRPGRIATGQGQVAP